MTDVETVELLFVVETCSKLEKVRGYNEMILNVDLDLTKLRRLKVGSVC